MTHNDVRDPLELAGQGRHVLLVEDDESWAHTASQILQRAGYEVSLAPDYRKALEILEGSGPVDLLLTDIVMPKRVNGVALGRMARMRRGALRVLYMTAYDIPGLAAETEATVLIKPISEVDLVDAVGRALAA